MASDSELLAEPRRRYVPPWGCSRDGGTAGEALSPRRGLRYYDREWEFWNIASAAGVLGVVLNDETFGGHCHGVDVPMTLKVQVPIYHPARWITGGGSEAGVCIGNDEVEDVGIGLDSIIYAL